MFNSNMSSRFGMSTISTRKRIFKKSADSEEREMKPEAGGARMITRQLIFKGQKIQIREEAEKTRDNGGK